MPITTADIQTLEQHYRLDSPAVTDFVRRYHYLYPLLLEAIDPIRAHFPDATLALDVDDFADNPAYHSLMLVIWTERGLDDASARLDRLDATWWQERLPDSKNRLELHLRFVRA